MQDETYLGQIRHEGKWLDYARGTEASARSWQAEEPSDRRVVDWIKKEQVLIPAICEAFNTVRQGACDAPLDVHDNCPNAHQHGDSADR